MVTLRSRDKTILVYCGMRVLSSPRLVKDSVVIIGVRDSVDIIGK